MGGHKLCKSFITLFPDLCNTGSPVGFEDDSKYPGNKIVEFFARHRIRKFFAVSTAGIPVFNVAGTDFTPGGFPVFMASRAGAGEILPAGAAVKAAISNKGFVGNDGFHGKSGLG
jgi:hypothetical protein